MSIIGALPVTLANGTTADATQVMSDFNFIVSQVNANAAATAGGNTFTGSQVVPVSGGRTQAAQTAQVQDGSFDFATDTSITGGTITAALGPVITAYANTIYWVKVVNANSVGTGATTLNLNAIGALPVTDGNGNALLTGMIVANQVYGFLPQGGLPATSFILIGQPPLFNTTSLQIADPADPTKKIKLSASNIPTATTETLVVAQAGIVESVQGANIAAAATVNLTTATGDYVHITGNTGITAITLAQGWLRKIVTDGTPTFTWGASLIGPGNLTSGTLAATAGDVYVFVGEAAGVVRCIAYLPSGSGAAQGAATVFITSATGSGVASLNTFWTAAQATLYDVIEFEWVGVIPAANNATLNLRFSTDGSTFDSGANYSWAGQILKSSAAGAVAEAGNAVTFIQVCDQINNSTASSNCCGFGKIYNSSSASLLKNTTGKTAFQSSSFSTIDYTWGGSYNLTTALRGLQLVASGGNMTGTLYVYGRKKS